MKEHFQFSKRRNTNKNLINKPQNRQFLSKISNTTYLLVTSFHPSSMRLFFFGLVAMFPMLPWFPAVDNETMAHWAAAAAMVAATSELIASESRDFDDLAHEIMEVATALVISATVVALTVSRGLQNMQQDGMRIAIYFQMIAGCPLKL